MADEEEQPEPVAPVPVPINPGKYFKLADFWTATPHAWFGVIESQFRLRNITTEEDKFGLVAGVLPEPVARRVAQLLAAPPASCYTVLKAALLANHELTEIQKADLLFNMDDMGSRRPSDLLTEMLELVRPGEERTQLFAMLFLRRLPAQVRVQLTEDDHADLPALAAKADRCAAFLAKQSVVGASCVAAVSAEPGEDPLELTVAAFSRGGNNRGGKQGRGGKFKLYKSRPPPPPPQQEDEESPADLARVGTGLCFYHFQYGPKARSCRPPCKWQGN